MDKNQEEKEVPDLRISCVQTEIEWERPAANHNLIEKAIIDLAPTPGQIVVLPEMFPTGFSMDAPRVSQSMDGPSVHWMRSVAKRYGIVLVGSLAIRDGFSHYNRMLWVDGIKGHIKYYDKRHLFSFAGEHEQYTSGQRRVVIEYLGWRVMLQVCYDLRFPVWSRNQNDVDLMIYVANWPLPRIQAWQYLLPARAVENQVFVAGCNRIGSDGRQQLYTGQSVIYDMQGDLKAHAQDAATSITADLSMERLIEYRTRYPFLEDRDQFMFGQ